MKKNIFKKVLPILTLLMIFTIAFAGCNQQEATQTSEVRSTQEVFVSEAEEEENEENEENEETPEAPETQETPSQLTVRFGDEGEAFTMFLEDNTTSAAIANHVGTNDWRLPIYNEEEYENSDVMQYYDIPSRYEIPSNATEITSQKAGEVYYSDPNRIVLFFADGEVVGQYTKIGNFDYTNEFAQAVINNPVLEGWSNKIVLISD